MDLFGRKAHKRLMYLNELLIKDKEALNNARHVILNQEAEIIRLKQQIQFLKMSDGIDIEYPNKYTKEN